MDGDVDLYLIPDPEPPEFVFSEWEGVVSPVSSLMKISPGPCVLCGAPNTACTHETEGVPHNGNQEGT